MDAALQQRQWLLDSSTFINVVAIERLSLLVLLRSPLSFPEYVFRFELGVSARPATREAAVAVVNRKQIAVRSLTLEDLDRLAELDAPRRIGIGELACAVIAERVSGGVLCDDWKARRWIEPRATSVCWDCIEEFLLDAAARGHISEFDLLAFEQTLKQSRYQCRVDLRLEHLRRRLNTSRRVTGESN